MEIVFSKNIHQDHKKTEPSRSHGESSEFFKAVKAVASNALEGVCENTNSNQLHFKKLKTNHKIEKQKTLEDALIDIEKLVRRAEKNKKT